MDLPAEGEGNIDTMDEIPVIVRDTREQLPYSFEGIRIHGKEIIVPLIVRTLPTGDYSIHGHESEVTVERKSVNDFFGTITRGRERFEKELGRMAAMKRAAVVVEGRFSDVACPASYGSRINPESVIGTVASFWSRYGVPCFFLADRAEAERFTFKILNKFFESIPAENR